METNKQTICRIETSKGNITVKLYDETPQHRDNFVKLAKENFYDGTLFHRVIKNFMIQGGDPDSKGAPAGKMLGMGDTGYTLPAEFVYPRYFHKKGVLSAARQGDEVNPERRSSGCQFYIVTGQVLTPAQIAGMENQLNQMKLKTAFDLLARQHMKEIYKLRKNNDMNGLQQLQEQLVAEAQAQVADEPIFKFTPEQIEAYTTVGGTPHLDNQYTVFGEVVEGMEVIDAIQQVKTNRSDRPEQDVVIRKVVVVE
ncbi:MAG: peptidylprolyl isomerase [Bacteroidaceae bacterium]|nr:peptidylprolyl isomerase [Bacteroidaceae bacterium]